MVAGGVRLRAGIMLALDAVNGIGSSSITYASFLFAGTMREMFSAGVGAAHTGIPLHCVLDNQSVITDAFNNKKIVSNKTVLSLVAVSRGWSWQAVGITTLVLSSVPLPCFKQPCSRPACCMHADQLCM